MLFKAIALEVQTVAIRERVNSTETEVRRTFNVEVS